MNTAATLKYWNYIAKSENQYNCGMIGRWSRSEEKVEAKKKASQWCSIISIS